MDDRSFDRLARLLGAATDRRAGLKAALAAVLGGGTAAEVSSADASKAGKEKGRDKGRDKDRKVAGPDADKRKKRKKRCKPACGSGFDCVKGQCQCATGVTCGEACCRVDQTCQGGQCVAAPEPASCVAAGEPCKAIGIPCCDGLVCASSQGGDADVACYVPKTGRCERTADCVYGMSCRDGRCAPPRPGSLAAPCDGTSQQLCTTPGAVCTAYDDPEAPDGNYCTLPLESACEGDEECTCYKCWYANPGTTAVTREGQDAPRFACCGPEGYACSSDRNCCLGTSCVNGTCRGKVCVPDEQAGCDAGNPCCNEKALCVEEVCQLGVPTGDACSTAPGSLPCLDPAATCATPDSGSATLCVLPAGTACSADRQCASGRCSGSVCAALTLQSCGSSNGGATCKASTDSCVDSGGGAMKCLRAAGTSCTANAQCVSADCDLGVCKALTGEKCLTSNNGALCKLSTDTCSGTDPDKTCKSANGDACTAGATCLSGSCGSNGKCAALAGETCGTAAGGAECADTATPATCTAYDSGKPAGDYCLKANGKACAAGTGSITADDTCASGHCQNGFCVECTKSDDCPATKPVCNASGTCIPETCDVCASGCTYTTIQAAITGKSDGGTIAIDAGTYTENLAITDKSLTLKACNGAAVTVTTTSGTEVLRASITQSTPRSLTVSGLRFEGTKQIMIYGKDASTKMTLLMKHCTFAASKQYMWLYYIDAVVEKTDFLATTMFTSWPPVNAGTIVARDCLFDGLSDGTVTTDRAIDVPSTGANTTVTLENVEVRNYHCNGTGVVKTLGGTVLNMTGTTYIHDTSTKDTTYGGPVSIDGGALNIGPNVKITANGAPLGKGSGISNYGGGVVAASITGATASTVYGNVVQGTTTINDPQCRANNGGSCLT